MTQALRKLVTFDEFVAKYPDNTLKRYELHDGVIVEMPQPTGDHEEIIVFLTTKITLEYSRLSLPYGRPKTVLVKPPENESAYSPDVLILNLPNLVNEPLWKKESTVTQAASIPLVIEVVSTAVASSRETRPTHCLTNWRDDYHKKYADYEEMGIPEYWIVDYAALGGREFIGKPKQPTILVCCLDEGEYQINKFRGNDRIQSLIFPELNLTVQQIFEAGGTIIS
ncbi:Uma2 family endonuclease [Nostocaceae cyanobacterium CENA369]|uniref:Uma2 family endonuclease n=1 Tax=Dendronalium phyllosphericum CENA369 TaxID=1725256 RepID=A0A8J7I1A6_9NOST|nr:Uma2 family endonuclease [Dendronalium phyllosphericum]MBH8571673.1 Uma2 family endonuclease [Dendronalium phyllosphericum CENA369]